MTSSYWFGFEAVAYGTSATGTPKHPFGSLRQKTQVNGQARNRSAQGAHKKGKGSHGCLLLLLFFVLFGVRLGQEKRVSLIEVGLKGKATNADLPFSPTSRGFQIRARPRTGILAWIRILPTQETHVWINNQRSKYLRLL